MKTAEPTPLESFHDFLVEQIRAGTAADLSPDEVLSIWKEREATIAAVRESLADIEAGRTYPAADVLEELRQGL